MKKRKRIFAWAVIEGPPKNLYLRRLGGVVVSCDHKREDERVEIHRTRRLALGAAFAGEKVARVEIMVVGA